jgi:hypothetical protein
MFAQSLPTVYDTRGEEKMFRVRGMSMSRVSRLNERASTREKGENS